MFEVEFAGAEVDFLFLDGGVAFADGGVARAADDVVDAIEEIEVGGLVDAGEGEFEGGLLEETQGGFAVFCLVRDGVAEDFASGRGGWFGLVEAVEKRGALEETLEGAVRDIALVVVFDEAAGLLVGVVCEPIDNLEELVVGELVEDGRASGFLIFDF